MLAAVAAEPLRVAICDDHPIVRQGFRQLIESGHRYRVVSEYGSAAEVLAPGALDDVDLLVLDLTLPDGDGLSVLDELTASRPELPVAVLTMRDAPTYARDALARGARGFVTKRSAPDELPHALEAACRGKTYVSRDLAGKLTAPADSTLPPLTTREFAVFVRLARGESTQAIAEALSVVAKTVYAHRSSVLHKLNARSNLDLHRIARQHGLAP